MSDKKENILTAKMIAFCEHLAAGKSQRESYNLAYPANNRKDQITDSNACKLLSIAKVWSYYQSLLKESAKRSAITRESQLAELEEIKQIARGLQDTKEWRATIETQNKMLGLNEPDKLDMTSKGESIKPLQPIIVQTEEQKIALENLLGSK